MYFSSKTRPLRSSICQCVLSSPTTVNATTTYIKTVQIHCARKVLHRWKPMNNYDSGVDLVK